MSVADSVRFADRTRTAASKHAEHATHEPAGQGDFLPGSEVEQRDVPSPPLPHLTKGPDQRVGPFALSGVRGQRW